VEARTLYPRTVLKPAIANRLQAATRILEWTAREYDRRGVRTMREMLQSLKPLKMQYLPVWAVHTRDGAIYVQPAAVTAASEMWKLDVDGTALADVSGIDLPKPEVPCRAALAWLSREGVLPSLIDRIGIVYVPLYLLQDEYEGQPVTLVVEAATGRLLTDYPPANLGLSWNRISFLAYGAMLVAGVLVTLVDLVIPATAPIYGVCRRAVTSIPYPSWAIRPIRLALYLFELWIGSLSKPLIWLVVVVLLILIFSGRWKPHRWWRTRR
jgi:hypothetical protein